MIKIDDLTVQYYGADTAIKRLSLKVEQGEFVLLTGPSGCGKSTLARCLIGLIPHSSEAAMCGRVVVDGAVTTEHSVAELATHVGLVFQNPASQLFAQTVNEEVAFGPANLGLPADDVAERCEFALSATGIGDLRERVVKTLSVGEQQRLAIASVLAMRPKVLVLDEPTSNLDLKGTQAVLETLHRLRDDHGLTILLVEHRLSQAIRYADRVVVMNGGQILLDGAPGEVFKRKEFLSQLGIRYPRERLRVHRLPPTNEGVMVGRGGGRLLVELRGVEAGYGGRTVLKDLDLAVYRGEFVALVGDNGAGKTTLARLLAGLVKPTGGRVLWEQNVERLPLGRRVGLLFQNPLHQLFCDTVAEEMAFGPSNFGMFSKAEAGAILEATGLTALRARNPYALSVGQQQRVALGAILSLRPALLILDEPTMGQDWRSLSRVMDFLVELNGDGQSILLITHDHKLVCRYAERILALEGGRLSELSPAIEPCVKTMREERESHEVLGA